MPHNNRRRNERSTAHDRHTDTTGTSRRDYLKLAGGAAVVATGTAATAGTAAAKEVAGVEFADTVDMVEDAGCDPTGGDPCEGAIMQAAGDGVLLLFPPGEYLIAEPIVLEGDDLVGMLGTGDVTFVFPDDAGSAIYLDVTDVGTFVYRNIDWDITAENCAPGIFIGIDEFFYFGQLEVLGRGDSSGGFALLPAIRSEDGLGIIEEFVAREGSKFESAPRGGVLVSAGRNFGTLRFVDCQLEEFENNGIYAAASSGPIQVEGGVFRNNLRSQLRFSGEGSYIDGALVEVDYDSISEEAEPEGFSNARGIWWESKNTDPLRTGGEIRNTEVVIRSGDRGQTIPNTGGGIVVRRDGGACTIRDSRIQMDVTPRPAIYAKAPAVWESADKPAPPEPRGLLMENVKVVGDAKDQFAVQVEGRPGTEIRNCYFEQRFRYGVVLAGCDGSVVADSEFQMRGAPQIALWGSDEVTVENVTTDEPQPLVVGDSDYDEDGEGGRGPPENIPGRGPPEDTPGRGPP